MKILSRYFVTILVIVFGFSFSAQADFDGKWLGFGTWKFKGEGDGVRCSPMTINWVETEKTLSMQSGTFDCEYVVMHLEELVWTKKEGRLFDENQKEVGSYDGIFLKVYLPRPNPTTQIIVEAKRTANHLDYQEVWFNDQEKVYVIQGRLFTGG